MAKADMERLEKENQELREQLSAKQQSSESQGYSIQRELNKLRQTQKNTVPIGQINIRRSSDHKNIPLYWPDGQMVGPLSPSNAEQYIYDMAAKGISITVDKPTSEQIEAYKSTPEYKKSQEWEARRRAGKNRSRKSGQIEKLAQSIAEMSGKKIDEIHNIVVKK